MQGKHNRWSLWTIILVISLLMAACAAVDEGPQAPSAEVVEPAQPAATAPAQAEAPAQVAGEGPAAPGTIHEMAAYEELTGNTIDSFNEAPMLAERVQAGELPPVEERLPDNPVVIVPWNQVGEYGGTIRWDEYTVDYDHYFRHLMNTYTLFRDASESQYYNVGLTGTPRPWIFEGWELNDDNTEITIHLRRGMKWSDGTPVTTEDVRWRIENELLHSDLTPMAPLWMRWNPQRQGVTTEVEYIDEYSFKLSFAMPYGALLFNPLSTSGWNAFLAPAHYMQQFHRDFTDIEEILPIMQEVGYNNEDQWSSFYTTVWVGSLGDSGALVRHPFPTELPTLYPWVVEQVFPDTSYRLVRNPYYFVVDTAGNQLPYIDRLQRQFISSSELMNLDIIAGKVDVQGQFLRIDDFPLFKQNEAAGNYVAVPVRPWQHHVLIYWLNPKVEDETLSAALSEFDFRRALSIALDRNHINQAVFRGLGTPAQYAPPNTSPLYREELSNFAAEYDPETARQLLDELGYVDTNGDGWREAPDGSSFVLQMLFYEVTPAAVPGVQLATQYWNDIGLQVDSRQVEGSTFWQFQGSNEAAMSVWWANGPDFGDGAFIGLAVNVPTWRRWHNTGGSEGIEPPDWAKRIMKIQEERQVVGSEERAELDAEGWDLLVNNLVIIGTVESAKSPLILNNSLSNVEYGFDKSFVGPTYWEWAFQWFYTDAGRRGQ
jgi:peptide/nickel transport system substrate-binding protein